jgi:replicative DNA helicase
MSDLRESGSIEQDADIIAFVYRDEQYHDESYSDPEEIGKADLKIAKHSNGETGTIKLVDLCTYFLFSVNLLLVGVNYGQRTMQVCS